MLETKALPAHFLHIHAQTQIHLCISSIKLFAFHFHIIGPVCIQFCFNRNKSSLSSFYYYYYYFPAIFCFLLKHTECTYLLHAQNICSHNSLQTLLCTNLCRLISCDCDLLKLTLGPTTAPTARSCQTCAVEEELFSSPLIFSWNHICIFFVPGQQAGRLAAALLEVPA